MNRFDAIKLIAAHLLCVVSGIASAQKTYNKDSLISDKISSLEGFWNKYNELSSHRFVYESPAVIPALFEVKATDTLSRADYLNSVNDARIRQLKDEFGLAAVGNYQENLNPGIGAEDELVYDRRFQAGLDWNILADGYLDSRYKQQILANQKIINSLKPEVKISHDDYLIISQKVIYAFNTHKIKLLEKRQAIINDKIEIANDLYLLKHLPKLELMQIIQQQVDVSSMYQVYRMYNDQLSSRLNTSVLPKDVLPLFDLDPAKLTSYGDLPENDSILKLEIRNLELENKVLKDINLKSQFRYNYYDINNRTIANRDFFSAGLSVSVPLPLGFKANKNVVSSQAALMRFDQQSASRTRSLELLNYIYEFRYKLKQYNNFNEKHRKYEELIRVERVKEKFGDLEFNPVTALNLIDELLSVEIEMLDLQQEMYLQLLDILAKTPGSEPLSVLKPYPVPEFSAPEQEKHKSIYIWSEALTKYNVQYTDEYLRLNKISNAIISVRKDGTNKALSIELINKLFSNGITSELLIGSNEMLTEKDPLKRIEGVLAGTDLSKISALHLDVEPHVLSDWQTNKEKYLSMYVELLRKSKTYCSNKGIKLNVSIPVFYPEETLKEIYALADNVYLMAYEHNDAAFITRKVKEEFSLGKGKTIIALRAADFRNRTEFESLLNEVSAGVNTSRFALHDLESFIKLDEVSVGGNEK
ncbi:MAG TPA: TolC family protein [Bacteroidia bacterium]